MGVEDNYHKINNLNANTTFYNWVAKENDEIIPKLNYINVYTIIGGDGVDVLIGTVGTTGTTAGTAVVSVSDTIPGVTVGGDLVISGILTVQDGTTASSIVTSVNGMTGDVTLSLVGPTGDQGPTGPAGSSPDPIFISKNQLINGNFDIWQRGTSFVGKPNTYFADRWVGFGIPLSLSKLSTSRIVRNEFSPGQTDVLGDPDYYASVSIDHTGFSVLDLIGIENRIEGPEKFIGEKIYVDGYLRLSGSTGCIVDVYMRRNIDGSTYTTEIFTDQIYVSGSNWTEFLVDHETTFTGSTFTSDGYVAIGFKLNNLDSGVTLDFANIRTFSTQGVTLTDSPFRESSNIQEELRKCSRFYQRSYDLDKTDGSTTMLNSTDPDFTSVRFNTTNNKEFYYDFPVEMRTAPTISLYSPSSGVVTDGYNKTAGLDMRLTSGTSGWNGRIRLHTAGQATLNTTTNTKGIVFDIASGAVIFDDIFVHYVANSDYNI